MPYKLESLVRAKPHRPDAIVDFVLLVSRHPMDRVASTEEIDEIVGHLGDFGIDNLLDNCAGLKESSITPKLEGRWKSASHIG